MVKKLASAIYNDIVSGLAGIVANPTISMEQLEDDVVDERLQIIKEYSLKDLVPRKDLFTAINCIQIDCLALDKCGDAFCNTTEANPVEQKQLHFEIPQLVNDFAEKAIEYIGATDKSQPSYKVYTDSSFNYHKYLRRGGDKPYVYIETTPNENNMYDGWVFNAPFVKVISIIGIFKDPRQLENYECCDFDNSNLSFIDTEVKKRLTEKKIRYYRQLLQQPQANTQTYA